MINRRSSTSESCRMPIAAPARTTYAWSLLVTSKTSVDDKIQGPNPAKGQYRRRHSLPKQIQRSLRCGIPFDRQGALPIDRA